MPRSRVGSRGRRVIVARPGIRDVVDHGMRLATLPEILERFRIFHTRENLDEAAMEAALLRDLEDLAARGARHRWAGGSTSCPSIRSAYRARS